MFSRFIRFVIINTFKQRQIITRFRNEYNYRVKCNVLRPTIPIYLAGFWAVSKKKDEVKPSLSVREIILAKADVLFDQEDYNEIYELLYNYKDEKDVEILWRLSRAMYKIAKSTSNVTEAKRLVYEAYEFICQALNLQEDHWAVNKWVAILLNSKTSYEGTKMKIKELEKIKKHMLRASELNPGDATTLYMIGNWCYQLADLAWFQRKIASTIFIEPPTCAFEEALQYFERAESVDPNFYSDNLLMLGKTCLKLNKKDEAIKYLKIASECTAKTDNDQKAKQEALKILLNIQS